MDKKRVEIEKKQLIFDDRFKIVESHIRYQRYDGQMSPPVRQLVFERGNAVGVLLFNRDSQKILLVEQFRYATYDRGDGWIREVVAGKIDEGEDPITAGKREVEEEVGYRADTLTYIATFYTSPGGTSERMFLYYAEVGNKDHIADGGGLVEEHEDIRLVEYSIAELEHAIATAQIIDAKTLIAAQWFQLHNRM